MKDKELYIRVVFWSLWTSLVLLCVFYIIHNAHWFIGDDAIVIRHTGFGKPFLPSDTVSPLIGRFYPFSYLVYDLLLLFGGNRISPTAHYSLQAVFFVIFAVSMTVIVFQILRGCKAIWKYSISFLALLVFIGRVYPQYLECFSTSWFGYSILAMFICSTILFYEKQKWIYGVMALLIINYHCYCGENAFVLPLSMGVCTLLFQRKSLTSKEKVFNWLLVGSALLFLCLYAIICVPYIQSAYDGGHGSESTMVGNAFRMVWAQKLLVIALVLFIIRLVDIIKNKRSVNFYDILLVVAAVCCCGNFILRLNWTLYYNGAALLAGISILFFSIYYLRREKYAMVLFLALGLYFGWKIPVAIEKNQQNRKDTCAETKELLEAIDKADEVFWYAPETEDEALVMTRNYVYWYLCNYIGWFCDDDEYSLKTKTEFNSVDNTVWLTASANDISGSIDMQLAGYGDLIFDLHGVKGFRVSLDSIHNQKKCNFDDSLME